MFGILFRLFRLLRRPARKNARVLRISTWVSSRQYSQAKRGSGRRTPTLCDDSEILQGKCHVIDGDTIIIRGTRIRLAGIDAPELDHPWGKKSKYALVSMCKGQIITAIPKNEFSYERVVAKCYLPDGTDIAARLVEQGLALDWPKFSGGEYRKLEPPGVRKKLWLAAAKQQGRIITLKGVN